MQITNKHELRRKRFLEIQRKLQEIHQAQIDLGYMDLKVPIFIGWTIKFIPRADIQNREDAAIFWEIIKIASDDGFIRNKGLLKHKDKKYRDYPYQPKFHPISEDVYDKLSPDVKKHFHYSEWESYRYGFRTKRYVCSIPNFYWDKKLVRKYKTKVKVIDEVLLQKEAELESELDSLKAYANWHMNAHPYTLNQHNRRARRDSKGLLKKFLLTGEVPDVFPFSGRGQARYESW